ncbi:MAG: hypothetical protein ACMG6H_13815 [Acidobacteriota bacterium]
MRLTRKLPLAFVLYLAACVGSGAAVGTITPGVPKVVEVGSDFDLSPSQSAVIDGGALTVTFVKVSEDSRCPTGVVCIWAGDDVTAMLLGAGESPKTPASLHTTLTPRAVSSGAYVVSLVGVKPAPKQGSTIPQSSYVATFRVTRE